MDLKASVSESIRCLKDTLFINDEVLLDLIISYLTEYNPFQKTDEISNWLNEINRTSYFDVKPIPFSEMKGWHFDGLTNDLVHNKGAFFKIRGLNIKTNIGAVKEWSQPIIYQPEIGLLGIIAKKINGVLYFLVQAKAEPGNINTFQLSPTVQATRSNFKQLHGGKPTAFLDYFSPDCPARKRFILDQLQSEQGARFYKKRNRNCIVELHEGENVEITEFFKWLTYSQIITLMGNDNTVNMDLRSVLSNISLGSNDLSSNTSIPLDIASNKIKNLPLPELSYSELKKDIILSSQNNTYYKNSYKDILHKLTQRRFEYEVEVELLPLKKVNGWEISKYEIFNLDRKYFKIMAVEVSANSREIMKWDQPIVQQYNPGIVGMVYKKINGILHFLVQLKMESGNLDVLEFAPTVQCLTDSYNNDDKLDYIDLFTTSKYSENIIHSSMQSEEGGRFYREENRNMIFDATNNDLDESRDYIWLTLSQLKFFIQFNNYLNVETRSVLSLM